MENNDDWRALSANFEIIVVPDFAAPAFGTPDYPWAWSLNTAFPLVFQRIGHKKLVSGSSLWGGGGKYHVRLLQQVSNAR